VALFLKFSLLSEENGWKVRSLEKPLKNGAFVRRDVLLYDKKRLILKKRATR